MHKHYHYKPYNNKDTIKANKTLALKNIEPKLVYVNINL